MEEAVAATLEMESYSTQCVKEKEKKRVVCRSITWVWSALNGMSFRSWKPSYQDWRNWRARMMPGSTGMKRGTAVSREANSRARSAHNQ